jgi:hypothetical protein
MKTVSARQANHDFTEGNPDHETEQDRGVIVPYRPPRLTPERQAAIVHAIEVMAQVLPWGAAVRFSRAMKTHRAHDFLVRNADGIVLILLPSRNSAAWQFARRE